MAKKKSAPATTRGALTEADVTRIVDSMVTIETELAHIQGILDKTTKRHMVRFRTGGDKVVRLVAKLAKEQGVAIKAFPVDAMVANLDEGAVVQPIADAADTLDALARDFVFVFYSRSWAAAEAYYTILDRMAQSDSALAKALEPAKQFFKLGPRSSKNGSTSGDPAAAK